MYELKRWPQWQTYGDAFYELIKEGATLIADRENLGINRMLDKPIPHDAVLYVICDEPTFQRLQKKGAGA
jgi:voltage-gated potassium channel